MKKIMQIALGFWIILLAPVGQAMAQKIDDERMTRDIEVAENVLSTLIKQQMDVQQNFFGMEIKGTHLPGYGVTFRMPTDFSAFVFSIGGPRGGVTWERKQKSYRYNTGSEEEIEEQDGDGSKDKNDKDIIRLRDRSGSSDQSTDSLRDAYNLKLIKAAKDFIVDYGDFLSQLGPNERIVVTNQGDQNKVWFLNNTKRTHIVVEGLKSDITAFKQGKITREQALSKVKVVNTESVETKEPDIELISSIFNRLYRSDLSKTFFVEDNIYYERLRDYGVVYTMHVYSSNQSYGEGDTKKFSMPTVGLKNVDQATRDKKVTELYPKFEQDLKDNILEYGRTLKSLKDEEMMIFNVTLTKCKGCGIPSTLEVSVKSTVLKDFGSGKMDKQAAMSKFTVKKGPNQ